MVRPTSFSDKEAFWGNKYDVFYLGSSIIDQFKWLAAKYVGLVKTSGWAGIFWPGFASFKPVIGLLLIFFHVAGIFGFILERKYHYLTIFLLPIVTAILLNIFGVWPFGPFRANLFLFIYFAILTVNGFYFFINNKNRILQYLSYFVIVVFLLVQLPINFDYYSIKPRYTWAIQSNVKDALETIIQYEKVAQSGGDHGERPIFAESHAYVSTNDYYLTHHPNSAHYTKSLQALNLKYYHYESGLKLVGGKHVPVVTKNTILGILLDADIMPTLSRGYAWLVIAEPGAVDAVESFINRMPKRIVYRKKISYGSLVVLLEI